MLGHALVPYFDQPNTGLATLLGLKKKQLKQRIGGVGKGVVQCSL